MEINIQKFPVSKNDQETIEEISLMFPDTSEFRVSPFKYDAGIKLPGSSEKCVCFVISGSCELTFSNAELLVVKRGDVFDWPRGRYWIKTGDSEGVKYVKVWDLKEIIQKRSKNT